MPYGGGKSSDADKLDGIDSTGFVQTSALDTDAALAANSDAKIATQKAIKAFLSAVADGAAGGDRLGMTPITETGAAATVQAIIEALITRLKAVTDSASGADLLGMTVISETGANATVQSIIEALVTRIKAVTDSASGGDLVGMTAISGWTGATTQAILESAKTAVDGKLANTQNLPGINKTWGFTVIDPPTAYTKSTIVPICTSTIAALHVTKVVFRCDADPTTEVTGDIKYADDAIGLANAAVIQAIDTTAGAYTSGTLDVAVPAGKFVYLSYDAGPDAATKFHSCLITYDCD